uniref:Uncharacterized protein n=1 Tax=Aegilops tauschii subsp. strangulata TaxID=200361 RepID=A0A453CJK8_AEGTS
MEIFANCEVYTFFLQNSAHEDQFRPWTDDLKDQDVIPLMDLDYPLP